MKTVKYFLLCFVALPVSSLLLVFGIAGAPLAWTVKALDNAYNDK